MTTDSTLETIVETINGDAAFEAAFANASETATELELGTGEEATGGPATDRELALDNARYAVHAKAYVALLAVIDAYVARQVATALTAQAQRA